MTLQDVLTRQRGLHRRIDRRCCRDDCNRTVSARQISDLCVTHWRAQHGYADASGVPRVDGAIPEPPIGMTRMPQQGRATRPQGATITGACVLCGSRDLDRRDQSGRARGPKSQTRMLQGMFETIPFVTGSRCDACDAGVQRHGDKASPILAWTQEALGRADVTAGDMWCGVVLNARAARREDPTPSAPWAHTSFGPVLDRDRVVDRDPLTDDEVARLRSLLSDE